MKYHQLLLCIIIFTINLGAVFQKLLFLEKEQTSKLNRNFDMLLKSSPATNDTISKTFQDNNSVYELVCNLNYVNDEYFLVMNLREENNIVDYYLFEGSYQKLIMNDPNWKILTDRNGFFFKILKTYIEQKKFKIDSEKADKFIVFEFTFDFIGEETTLKIKLNKKNNSPFNPNQDLDEKSLYVEISNLKSRIEALEKFNQNKEKKQELVSEFPMGSYVTSTSFNFELNTSKTGDIEFEIEIEVHNLKNNNSPIPFYGYITLNIDNGSVSIPLFNTMLSNESSSIIQIKKSRFYFLVKGKYTGTLSLSMQNNGSYHQIKSFILRAIQH